MHKQRRRTATRVRRNRWIAGGVAVALVGVAAIVGVKLLRDGRVPVLFETCTASAGGSETSLAPDQMANAATIAAVGLGRGLGERAVTIGLATALQESKLRNLDSGDRDSLGLFQQRPSQGWGTPRQILDPVYAARAFYSGLEKVDGYAEMPLTVAAQRVQRSGFPDAYARHEPRARVLAAALTGKPAANLTCSIRADRVSDQSEGPDGLTPRAATLRKEVERAFGRQKLGGFEPGGVGTGHIEGSAHYDGRAIDIFFRPVTPANKRAGRAMAHFLVAHAHRLHVATVIFDGRIWTARRSVAGWRDYRHPSGRRDNPILLHRDHVHVDVVRG